MVNIYILLPIIGWTKMIQPPESRSCLNKRLNIAEWKSEHLGIPWEYKKVVK